MKNQTKNAYHKLWEKSTEIERLSGVLSLLEWDHEVFMPEGGADFRAEQLKLLTGMIHQEKTGAAFSSPLSELVDLKTGKLLAKGLSEREESAAREWYRAYKIETALPKEFVEDLAKLTSEATVIWRKSRQENDFKSFAPSLNSIVRANQKKAKYLGFKQHPYDALIDLYEPGMTTDKALKIFHPLKKEIVALLKKITKKQKVDDQALYCPIPEEKQLAFCKKLLAKIGYDFKHGRLDLTTHPFCSGVHPTDSRITTRVDPSDIFGCILTILHEAGHSLYTMGLPQKYFGSPLGQAISMAIHESQSRFWETRIGLSLPFIRYLLPMMQKELACFQDLTPVEFYRAVNKVEPSFIRVEADEVTYPLHIILRFELEVALIEGSLKVKDLPEAWNSKMEELFGITPPNDAQGVLQDVHWSQGSFGYFPAYSLGNIYAALIFAHFAKEYPTWEERVAKGDFAFIKKFLHDSVYRWGRQYRSQELLKKITGQPFSITPYVKYLNEKYSQI